VGCDFATRGFGTFISGEPNEEPRFGSAARCGDCVDCVHLVERDGCRGHREMVVSTFANKNSATDPCPTGFTTASVHSKPWDPVAGEFVAGGVEVIDKFNCSDKVGTTDPLDGIYLIWVSIEDTSGATVYAESESEFFDTIDGDATVELPTLFKDAGYMDLTWDLIGSGNTRLSCAAAGIAPAARSRPLRCRSPARASCWSTSSPAPTASAPPTCCRRTPMTSR